MEGEIPPNISGNTMQEMSGKISSRTGTNTKENSLNVDKEVRISVKPTKKTEDIMEQKKYYSEEAEVQNMSPPQHITLTIHPPETDRKL